MPLWLPVSLIWGGGGRGQSDKGHGLMIPHYLCVITQCLLEDRNNGIPAPPQVRLAPWSILPVSKVSQVSRRVSIPGTLNPSSHLGLGVAAKDISE